MRTGAPPGPTSTTADLNASKPTMPATGSTEPLTMPPSAISMNTGASITIGPSVMRDARRKRQGTLPETPDTNTSPKDAQFGRRAAAALVMTNPDAPVSNMNGPTSTPSIRGRTSTCELRARSITTSGATPGANETPPECFFWR